MPSPFYNLTATPQWGLADQANRFASQQARLPYMMNLPGYGAMQQKSSANILSRLSGVVPQDVVNQIMQRGAERGVATGMGAGPNTNAAWLRALGLTSLGLQTGAEQEFSGAMTRTPFPEIWNPMAMYVPERKAEAELNVAKTPPAWSGTQYAPWGGFSEAQNLEAFGKRW